MIAGQDPAGAAEAGLHFVGDHEHVVTSADLAHGAQVADGGHDDAGLALDRLDDEGGDVEAHRVADGELLVERVGVTVRYEADP